jgi:hypothetical protein
MSRTARIQLRGWTISLGICTIWASARPDLQGGLSVSDREMSLITGANGPLMARRPDDAVCRPSAFRAGHILSRRGLCECYALSLVAAACRWLLLLLSPLLSVASGQALVKRS